MRPLAIVIGAILSVAGNALAESRSVTVSVQQSTNKAFTVSIWSDEKAEIRKDASLPEAKVVVQKMTGWRSMVNVFLVAGSPECMPAIQELLKDISSNPWLSLSYLRVGNHDNGETFVKSRNSIEPSAAPLPSAPAGPSKGAR